MSNNTDPRNIFQEDYDEDIIDDIYMDELDYDPTFDAVDDEWEEELPDNDDWIA